MSQIRWGLCCNFQEVPIKYYSTTVAYIHRLKSKKQDYHAYFNKIILSNLNSLIQTIDFCAQEKIGSFRINSHFFPLYNHVDYHYKLDEMADSAEIFHLLERCKKKAQEKNIRLTFHPDHFVVLSSSNESVIQNSIKELDYHAELATLLDADVINIHVGGVYGNKKGALEQFCKNFDCLSQAVKSRLTIENDDRCYTPQDLLPLCYQLKIPLVYDVHHHRCLSDSFSVEQASYQAYETWDREPLFHISSPQEGWISHKPQKHHDFIDKQDFPLFWLDFSKLTVEVEARKKELAVLKLIQEVEA